MGIPEGQSVIFYFLVTYNANICQILLKTKAQAKGKNALRDICFLSYNIRYPIVINNQGWWLNGWCYCYFFFFHEALSRHIYNELQGDRPTF